LKNKSSVADNLGNEGTLGVRIPDHWIKDVVRDFGKPIVSTSVNRMGEQYAKEVEDAHVDIKKKCSFAISEGRKKGSPSRIINQVTDETIIR